MTVLNVDKFIAVAREELRALGLPEAVVSTVVVRLVNALPGPNSTRETKR